MNANETYKETCKVIYNSLPLEVHNAIIDAKTQGKFNTIIPIKIDMSVINNYYLSEKTDMDKAIIHHHLGTIDNVHNLKPALESSRRCMELTPNIYKEIQKSLKSMGYKAKFLTKIDAYKKEVTIKKFLKDKIEKQIWIADVVDRLEIDWSK